MKYYAVRTPLEFKGVYTNKERFSEILKTKGVSSRAFNEDQKQQALEWAGVREIADAMQQVAYESTAPQKEKSDTEVVLNTFIQKGYYLAKITLINSEVLWLTLRDDYYLYSQSSYCPSINDYMSRVWNSKGEGVPIFDEKKFEQQSNYVKVLRRSKIKYLKNGIIIENYDKSGPRYSADECTHEENTLLYLAESAILSIYPLDYWSNFLRDRRIANADFRKACMDKFK